VEIERPRFQKIVSLLIPGTDGTGPLEGRPTLERFATPHTFNPALSIPEAMVAVAGAFSRIFLGSLLFAIYGVYSLVAWNAIKSFFWRAVTLPFLIIVFLMLFAALMIGISAVMKKVVPWQR
jgi:hypothetical protein